MLLKVAASKAPHSTFEVGEASIEDVTEVTTNGAQRGVPHFIGCFLVSFCSRNLGLVCGQNFTSDHLL